MLIVIGAVLGGFLGPILSMLDNAIGISSRAKQQKANYAVQREIAASLRTLVNRQSDDANPVAVHAAPCSEARNAGAGAAARAPASPPRPDDYHVDITAAALRTNQPSAPYRHWASLAHTNVPARPGQVRSGDHMLYNRPQAGGEPLRRFRASSAGLGRASSASAIPALARRLVMTPWGQWRSLGLRP